MRILSPLLFTKFFFPLIKHFLQLKKKLNFHKFSHAFNLFIFIKKFLFNLPLKNTISLLKLTHLRLYSKKVNNLDKVIAPKNFFNTHDFCYRSFFNKELKE